MPIVSATALLWVTVRVVDLPLAGGVVLAAIVSLGVLRATRSHLDVLDVFPELGKLPFASRLLGKS